MALGSMDTTPNTPTTRSRWVVMWNLPGCLPEMEPMHFDSWEDARSALLDELQSLDDSSEDADASTDGEDAQCCWSEVHEEVTGTEWRGCVGKYVYSLTKAPEVDPRIQALAKHLGEDPDEIEGASYGPPFDCRNEFKVGSREYLVLTDDEADDRTRDYILDSLWAFRPGFLAWFMPDGIEEDTVEAIIGERCEDANEPILALVNAGNGTVRLVKEAILGDGRGHFLSPYDGEENEEDIDGTTYYIYRVN